MSATSTRKRSAPPSDTEQPPPPPPPPPGGRARTAGGGRREDEIPWWEQERSRSIAASSGRDGEQRSTNESGRSRERERDWDRRGGRGREAYRPHDYEYHPRERERERTRDQSPAIAIALDYGVPSTSSVSRAGGRGGRDDSVRGSYQRGRGGGGNWNGSIGQQRGAPISTLAKAQSGGRIDADEFVRTPRGAGAGVGGVRNGLAHNESISTTTPSSLTPNRIENVNVDDKEEGEEEEVEIDLEEDKEPDIEKFLEERRRKREEILRKFQLEQMEKQEGIKPVEEEGVGKVVVEEKLEVDTPPVVNVERDGTGQFDLSPCSSSSSNSTLTHSVHAPDSPSPPPDANGPSPDFDLELIKPSTSSRASPFPSTSSTIPTPTSTSVVGATESRLETGAGAGVEEVSAADYNPDEDRKRDDLRRVERGEVLEGKGDVIVLDEEEEEEEEEEEGGEEEGDESEDDMFSIGVPKSSKSNKTKRAKTIPVQINRSLDPSAGGITDNFDDPEGYYKIVLGEVLDGGRYHVHAHLGRGMFSSVVRAKDTLSVGGVEEVAIKVIRSQESMYKAGMKEAGILRKLQEEDPLDKKHLIRLQRTFEHRGHLCLVFESLSMNLREVVKRFGFDVGINLRAVRAYASQMFLALSLLKKCNIMHADIKPDNILVSESKSVLKLCDLGSASDLSENDITPYLASRFYRAPEIILGLPYDCALDTWAIGCTLYELYTGKILFPGRTNNDMLHLMMQLKGKFTHKTIKKGQFGEQHFDENMNFILLEKDGVTRRIVAIPNKAQHDLRARLMPAAATKKMKEDELKLLTQFVDLLDKMLSLDPAKRPTPKELLNHPFLRS